MTNSEVVLRLKQLVQIRGTFKTIEVALKMPQNCLSNYASQKKPLPEKWVKPLSDYLENLNKKRVVLIEAEDGKFLFMQPDGSARKCTLVWEDKEIKMPDETYPITVTPLRLKIKTAPEVFNPVFDFGDDKFLIIEKYTKYPLKDKPQNKFEAVTWLKEKADSDAKIKIAWASR